MALWAIGRRRDRTLAELHSEFESGVFVRTHVLRPTWHHVLLDGAVAGRWTRKIRSITVEIEVRTAATITGTAREAVEREARAFGAFVGRDARLTISG